MSPSRVHGRICLLIEHECLGLYGGDQLIKSLGFSGIHDLPTPGSLEGLDEMLGEVRPTSIGAVLMPSAVDVRSVVVPKLRRTETTAMLRNHSSRYFPELVPDRVVSWQRAEATDDGRQRVVIAGASSGFLQAVTDACLRETQRKDLQFVPAVECWVSAGRARAGDDFSMLVMTEDAHLVLDVKAGRLDDVRQARAQASLRAERGTWVLVGEQAAIDDLGPVLEELDDVHLITDDPGLVAVRNVPGRSKLSLVTETVRRSLRRRRRIREALMWTTAASLVAAAAGLEVHRVNRTIDLVRAERSGHAEALSTSLSRRAQLDSLDAWIVGVRDHTRTTVDWASLVGVVGEALPEGTRLERVAGGAGELELSGSAVSAAAVVEALQRVRHVSAVELLRPVRREVGDTGPEDRFSVSVRFAELSGRAQP